LSTSLRTELLTEIRRSEIKKCPLLANLVPNKKIEKLAAKLEEKNYSPGEKVFNQN